MKALIIMLLDFFLDLIIESFFYHSFILNVEKHGHLSKKFWCLEERQKICIQFTFLTKSALKLNDDRENLNLKQNP